MIIDIDKGSEGFAKYVTNRDEDSYIVVDGDLVSFEVAAQYLRQEKNIEKPYYRVLLSFDEEDLNINQMTEIYLETKKRLLENYDEAEYLTFAVAHFDDVKPHIHMGIIANSMVNEKELRIMRGKKDIPRIDSLAETINYKFNLKSYRDSISLIKTTSSQKQRNRKAKKGEQWYPCEDDNIHAIFDSAAKTAENFDDFLSILNKHFSDGKMLNSTNRFGEKVYSVNKNTAFTSFLFSKEWFDANLSVIREKPLSTIKIKIKREKEEYYNRDYEKRSEEHREELDSRNIHEGVSKHKLLTGEVDMSLFDISEEVLERFEQLNLSKKDDKILLKELLLEVTPYFDSKEELELLLGSFNAKIVNRGIDKRKNGEFITIEKDGKKAIVQDEHMFTISDISKNEIMSGIKPSLSLGVDTEQNFAQKLEILNLAKNKEKAIFRELVLEEFEKLSSKDVETFELFLDAYNINKTSHRVDINKGPYITLSIDGKKISIYSTDLYSLYDTAPFTAASSKNAKNNLLHNSIQDIYYDSQKPESLNEFKLEKSSSLNYSIDNLDSNNRYKIPSSENSARGYSQKSKILDFNDSLILEKTLDFDDAAVQLVENIKLKKWQNVKIKGTDEFRKAVFDELKKQSHDYRWMETIAFYTETELYVVKEGEVKAVKKQQESQAKSSKLSFIDYESLSEKQLKAMKTIHRFLIKQRKEEQVLKRVSELTKLVGKAKEKKEINSRQREFICNLAQIDDAELFDKAIGLMGLKPGKLRKNKTRGDYVSFENLETGFNLNVYNKHVTTICSKKIDQEQRKKEAVYKKLMQLGYYNQQSMRQIYAKEKLLKNLYNQSFEYYPILNYNIKEINKNSSSKRVVFNQKKSVFTDEGDKLNLYRSKSIKESVRDLMNLVQSKKMKKIKITGNHEFRHEVREYIKSKELDIDIVMDIQVQTQLLE